MSLLFPSRVNRVFVSFRSVAKDEVELSSQKELFSFLQSRIEQLKEESVSGQMAALTAMEKK